MRAVITGPSGIRFGGEVGIRVLVLIALVVLKVARQIDAATLLLGLAVCMVDIPARLVLRSIRRWRNPGD